MMTRAAVATLIALVLWVTAAHAGPPTEQLQVGIDRVFQTLADPQLKGPDKVDQRRTAVFMVAEHLFDFAQTAKLTLGAHWDTLTPEQRDEFTRVFKGFIEKAYLGTIDFGEGAGKVVYTAEAVEGNRAVVKSKVVTAGGNEIPVDFRLIQSEAGRWRLYDVNYEGMSLVGNYRVQFNRVIKAGSYDELVQKLRAKQQ